MERRRRRIWLSCPTCDEQLFLLRGFHLEGERRTCRVCGTVASLVVNEREGETRGALKVVDVVGIGQPQCDGSCNRAKRFLCPLTCERARDALTAWDWKQLGREAQTAIDSLLEETLTGNLKEEEIETFVGGAFTVFDRGTTPWSENWYRERAQAVVAWRAAVARRRSP